MMMYTKIRNDCVSASPYIIVVNIYDLYIYDTRVFPLTTQSFTGYGSQKPSKTKASPSFYPGMLRNSRNGQILLENIYKTTAKDVLE